MDILEYWPLESPPRPVQITVLKWLQKQTAKYVILQAPVGSGKSAIALTYSRYLSAEVHYKKSGGDSFILTPQRILQEQYARCKSLAPVASLYGRSNYTCASKSTTCDIGKILKSKCDFCPYTEAVKAAKRSPNVVLNYTLALLLFGYTGLFEHDRSLMVLDECHQLEEHLTEFNAVSVFYKTCEKLGIKWQVLETIAAAQQWLIDVYIPALSTYVDVLYKSVEPLFDKSGVDLTPSEIKLLREYNKLQDHTDDVTLIGATPLRELSKDFVLVFDKTTMKFKHLMGASNFQTMLDPICEKFLFMSSTILDYKGFCGDLGIDSSQAAFLDVDSEFPPEHRPVIYMPQTKMNAAWNSPENQSGRDRLLSAIKQLLEMHNEHSGIIHTGNFQIAKWLVENLDGKIPHQILHHNPDSGDDRNAIINQHTATSEKTVLISPSITEGLDLMGDASRFAIIVKIPFGFLGDQWIKKRLEISQQWYQRQALTDIIQGGGRVVRSASDWGSVYILDSSWDYLLHKTRHMIPKWWLDAYTVM